MIDVLRRQRRLFGLMCAVFGFNIFNVIYSALEKRWLLAVIAGAIALFMGAGVWILESQSRDVEDELDRRMKWPLN